MCITSRKRTKIFQSWSSRSSLGCHLDVDRTLPEVFGRRPILGFCCWTRSLFSTRCLLLLLDFRSSIDILDDCCLCSDGGPKIRLSSLLSLCLLSMLITQFCPTSSKNARNMYNVITYSRPFFHRCIHSRRHHLRRNRQLISTRLLIIRLFTQ